MNAKNIIAEYDVPSTGLWAALVFVVSLNLRPAIAAVGPLLTQIGADLSWGEGVQGVLTAIPLLAFAAVSPLVTFIEAVSVWILRFCRPCCALRSAISFARIVAMSESGWER